MSVPTLDAEVEAYKEKLARVLCKKRRYPSLAAAESALQECSSRGRDERRFYRCTMCCGWHLTSCSEPERPTR